MATRSIYLDANASSRLRPAAREAITAYLDAGAANPSSVHGAGRRARARLASAREQVADFLGLDSRSDTIVFTSGATESCNQLVRGLVDLRRPGRVISSTIEHPAVLEPLSFLAQHGFVLDLVAPHAASAVRVEDFTARFTPDTALVVVMAANNESGASQPVAEVAAALRSHGYSGPIACDVTQALGKSPLKIPDLFAAGVTAVAISGHKLGAPSGVGATVLAGARFGLCHEIGPLVVGGAQEQRHRGGTENVCGITAFGAVCAALAADGGAEERSRRALRELCWELVRAAIDGAERLTPPDRAAISNTLMLRVCGVRGDDLVAALDVEGVSASAGSACASGRQEVSHVALSFGLDRTAAREVIRLSLDWDTTEEDIRAAVSVLERVTRRMRQEYRHAA